MLPINIWWIDIFDYPLIEFTLFTFITLVLYVILFRKQNVIDYLFLGGLFILLILQVSKLFPYSTLGNKQLGDSSAQAEVSIKIFEANVLQKNERSEKLLHQIKNDDPDILLLTEINMRWQRSIDSGIGSSYRYKVRVPQDNTYGMLLYSKLKLENARVNYRVDGKIPSINTNVILSDSTAIRLYAIHPTPPDPEHKSSSSDRGIEMVKTGLMLIEEEQPIIVLGDFNEVAWSQNVSLFQKISGLLDVRKGRGFYNTFDAKVLFMKWPLDQVFASEHFRVETIKTWDYMGSDHFPFSATLTYEPIRAADQKPHPINKDMLEMLKKNVKDEELKRGEDSIKIL
ncbi:endonuclease/exonuclease/phosphatase family protein [Flavimarina sp. Hel_I_48]|uniref:endonuclease/exonuclease/phosphatase family protein n=1 Tax=Flavimarina sp. Hel_I_48 TaxID=1392488 RepID=UPI000691E038|nr:endonuclease/exonuclease/phosphatase family protein [Flavimarina sp. Hel_I_48]